MLAYVFCHQRAATTTKEEYHESLVAFHRVLGERQPQGFVASAVLEMAQVPWMADGIEVYEDWYLVENSAALDPLDEAAVTGICREPHNRVARQAGNGTGGLYRLKQGTFDPAQLSTIRSATWFDKPAGMSYEHLYALLREGQIASQDLLWQRQMTMGPALEYCLHSAQPRSLATELQATQVAVQPIFVPGA